MRILFGHEALRQTPLYWEPTNTARFMNTNTGIIGTMGTGKTQFTKSLITQLMRQQDNNVEGARIGLLIFDYKSDYVDDAFSEANQEQAAAVVSPAVQSALALWRYADAAGAYRDRVCRDPGQSLLASGPSSSCDCAS